MDIGPVVPGGMGPAPIGWQDIAAWQSISGVALVPWQAGLLRRLSSAYLAMTREAERPDCAAPWSDADYIAFRRAKVAQSIRGLFGAMVAPKG